MVYRYAANTFYRQGTRYAIGAIIDGHLTEDLNDLLYRKWKSDWADPLEFSGNTKAITADMILEVPEDEFNKTYGKKAAIQIRQAAKNAA